jgi:hypothetical protein
MIGEKRTVELFKNFEDLSPFWTDWKKLEVNNLYKTGNYYFGEYHTYEVYGVRDDQFKVAGEFVPSSNFIPVDSIPATGAGLIIFQPTS